MTRAAIIKGGAYGLAHRWLEDACGQGLRRWWPEAEIAAEAAEGGGPGDVPARSAPADPWLTVLVRAYEVEQGFSFSVDDVTVRPISPLDGEGEYDLIGYDGAETDSDPAHAGYPALPVITRHLLFPPDTRIDGLRVTVVDREVFPGSYEPLPIPGEDGDFVPPEQGAYGSDEPYPATPISLTVDGHMKGYHFVTVRIWPLQYVGADHRIFVLTDVELAISDTPLSADNRGQLFHRLRDHPQPFDLRPEVRWLRNHVLNPEALDLFYRPEADGGQRPLARGTLDEGRFGGFTPTTFPSLEGPPVEMLIITDDQTAAGDTLPGMVDVFQDWADWKTLKGIPTAIKTVSWIDDNYPGVDRPEKFRALIKDAATAWGTEYVLLGGDVDIVPTRLVGGTDRLPYQFFFRADSPADMFYAELDDCWNLTADAYYLNAWTDAPTTMLQDIWVARLPVRNAAEATAVLSKISSYEHRPGSAVPADTSYYHDVLLAAGPTNSWCKSELSDGVYLAQQLAQIVEDGQPAADILRMFAPVPDSSQTCYSGGPSVRCFAMLIDSIMVPASDVDLTVDNFRDALDDGPSYVYHVEHSWRDRLGLTGDEAIGLFTPCGAGFGDECDNNWKLGCKAAYVNYLNTTYAGWREALVTQRVAALGNAPEYSVVVSDGSYVNQFDLDAISEQFLRNPDGGAVAFFGKTASLYSTFDPPRHFFENVFQEQVGSAAIAAALATNACSPYPGREGITRRVLGDPEMPLWTDVPGSLSVSQSSGSVTARGAQTITMTIVDDDTDEPIEGARVCIQDHDLAYAVAWTDSSGVARFPAFTICSVESVSVVASAQNYETHCGWLRFGSVTGDHYIVFDDFCGPVYVPQPGDTQDLCVIAKDIGGNMGYADGIIGYLWPTSGTLFDLKIMTDASDDGREPENTYIGAQEACPPAMADSFRIPANWEAIRPEGMPEPGDTTQSAFLLWRDNDALWHLRTRFVVTDADSIFEGLLTTQGGFSDVGCDAETTGVDPDWVDWGGPESDTLSFHFEGDVTADELTFRIEAVRWLAVQTDSVSFGSMSAGDTSEGDFYLAWDETAPDKELAVFTLAVHDDEGNWWYSDLFETLHGPQTTYIAQRPLRTPDSGSLLYPWRLRVWPTLGNAGTGAIDSARVTLVKTAGTALVKNAAVAFGTIEPGEQAEAATCFIFWDTSEAAFDNLLYEVTLTTYYPNDSSTVQVLSDMDVVLPEGPSNLIADEGGGAVTLRWEESSSADLWGYHVFRCGPVDTTRLTIAPVIGTLRYEATGLDALDTAPSCIDYRFAVVSVDSSGNESELSEAVSDTARVMLPECAGWPKQIPGGSRCAPKVFDVDGDGDLEVFGAGHEIYAWHHNGDPLIGSAQSNPSGLFYDPPDAPEGAWFVEALAVGRLDSASAAVDVVGNLQVPGIAYRQGSVHVVRYVSAGDSAESRWTRPIDSWAAPPILANLDDDELGELEVLLPGNNDSVYVWTHGGSTFRNESETGGNFLANPRGALNCYRSLAVGDVAASSGMEIVQVLQPGYGDTAMVAYPTNSYEPTALWQRDEPSASGHLSTPLIGDFDNQGGLEFAVTRQWQIKDGTPPDTVKGAFGVFNAADGSQKYWKTSLYWHFVALEDETGIPPAVVGDLDSDGDLELVGGGWDYGQDVLGPADQLYVHALDDGSSDTCSTADGVAIPSRKFPSINTQTQPVLADIDGDGRVEILVPTDGGYLAGYEWRNGQLAPERGWPQLFPDVPLTPTIADVADAGDLYMLVQDRSGLVHLFRLPAASTASCPWGEYGHDPGNSFNTETPRVLEKRTGPPPIEQSGSEERRLGVGPNPMGRPAAVLRFRTTGTESIRIEVVDVQGRLVRVLASGVLAAGPHTVSWDGRDDKGVQLGSGIYFARLVRAGGVEVKRISVVR